MIYSIVMIDCKYNLISIPGQVRLVCLVRLQTDNFRVHDEQTVNGLRKIA
jgi:hypothetical protein